MNCTCKHGEYHGVRESGVSTMWFWCPKTKKHGCEYYGKAACIHFEPGTPKKFDKRGNELGGGND